MKTFLAILFGISLVTAKLTASELNGDEIRMLKYYPETVFRAKYDADVLENEIEVEGVVGRALLLMEKRKATEMRADKADEELGTLFNKQANEIEWLTEWYDSYLVLTLAGTPGWLAYYERYDKEKAEEFSNQARALMQSMTEVVESNGERTKVDAMKTIREKFSLLVPKLFGDDKEIVREFLATG